jgi:hypothetical protein
LHVAIQFSKSANQQMSLNPQKISKSAKLSKSRTSAKNHKNQQIGKNRQNQQIGKNRQISKKLYAN